MDNSKRLPHDRKKVKQVYRFDQITPSSTVKAVLANSCIKGVITHEQHLKIFDQIYDLGVKPKK